MRFYTLSKLCTPNGKFQSLPRFVQTASKIGTILLVYILSVSLFHFDQGSDGNVWVLLFITFKSTSTIVTKIFEFVCGFSPIRVTRCKVKWCSKCPEVKVCCCQNGNIPNCIVLGRSLDWDEQFRYSESENSLELIGSWCKCEQKCTITYIFHAIALKIAKFSSLRTCFRAFHTFC